MDAKPLSAAKIAEIASKVVGMLDSASSSDRQKVIQAVLTMLGESSEYKPPAPDFRQPGSPGKPPSGSPDQGGLPIRAKTWIQQNQLTMEQVDQVFHITKDGVAIVAAEAPGKKGPQRTINTYVLQGLSRLLASGEPTFSDKDARSACEQLGCYDRPNHTKSMKSKGNLFSGTKKTSWTLTGPGLKHGAQLVKTLSTEE